ncbi:hypothetical protein PanWU01x14_118790 [Parasponia andersonii]|uniref:Uncharacterized protein n=1 Tax=Parasponia andersonii TaxID=3476 RepID=A0A2P5CVU4_PARAD|nr:hypothetical protein PanWU01x14_118790 [Parasponia andersonii]
MKLLSAKPLWKLEKQMRFSGILQAQWAICGLKLLMSLICLYKPTGLIGFDEAIIVEREQVLETYKSKLEKQMRFSGILQPNGPTCRLKLLMSLICLCKPTGL